MTGDGGPGDAPNPNSGSDPNSDPGGATGVRRAVGRLAAPRPLDARDARWLGAGLGAGLVAVAVYLATNAYPAYGAGLYVRIAREIVAHGYALPAHIPGYTAAGVPFAYPPLQFYLLAVLLDAGADPVAVARLLPAVGVLAGLVPTYLLARDYAGSRPWAAAATAAVALNPQLLQWHLSAGGVVRAFAFCYAMVAVYAGLHVFDSGSRRAVAAGLVAFAATLLAHPTYALFVVVTYLLLWGGRDRSAAGFARGAVVGLGGVAVASPWLAWAVATHGPGAFAAAAGTHGGVGGGAGEVSPYSVFPLLGAAYLLVVRRDRFLPAWTVAAELLFAQPRFVYAVGSVALAAVGVDAADRLRGRGGDTDDDAGTDRRAALAAACLVVASLAGGAYLAHEMTLSTDPSTPEFLDEEATDAMAWAASETPPDATFVVVGDAAEWLPALADRTILVGPWGVEWRNPELYDRHLDAYESVSRCRSAACVETAAATVGGAPDYVYVPKGAYTVRGAAVAGFGTLERSFALSPAWERAYENDGVVIYRAAD